MDVSFNYKLSILKNSLLIGFILVAISSGFDLEKGFNPQTKEITTRFFSDPLIDIPTPAFQKKKGASTYGEVIEFIQNTVESHAEYAELASLGTSQKGLNIPIIFLRSPTAKNPLRIWFQGGLHGDEIGSVESMLFLLHELLTDSVHLLEQAEFAIVPVANPDGFSKEDRFSANGLDLNRDQTKMLAPETEFLKDAFHSFAPEIAVDFHEYRPYRKDYVNYGRAGITSPYDAMFLHTSNENVPEDLRKMIHRQFVLPAMDKMEEAGYRTSGYFSTVDIQGKTHFRLGSASARSTSTSYALSNTISSLIEIRGVGISTTSLKRRVHSAFLIGMSYIHEGIRLGKGLKEFLHERAAIEKATVLVSYNRRMDTLRFIDLDKVEVQDFYLPIQDLSRQSVDISRVLPQAYLILGKDIKEVESRLNLLNIQCSRKQLSELPIERLRAYAVDNYSMDGTLYEGSKMQNLTCHLEPLDAKEYSVKQEVLFIPVDQPRMGHLVELLEPDAPNSLFSFSIIQLTASKTINILRYEKG